MSSKSGIPFTSPRWQRLNEGCFDASDNLLTITSGPNTDWWRTSSASEPEASVNRHSGPVVYIDVPQDETHWKAGVWISGDFSERFQQATLFVGAGDYEASNDPWIKAGVELEHGIQFIGSVVANPYSDWAIQPSPLSIGPGANKLFIEIKRTGSDLVLSYTIAPANDKDAFHAKSREMTLMREVKGFLAQGHGGRQHIGLMVCGPKSEKTKADFLGFTFETLTRSEV